MNREDIKNYLSNPGSLDKRSGLALKEIIGTFPYYSLLYLLLARSYKNEGNPALQDVIGKAAAYSPDREGLYLFLHRQGEKSAAATDSPPAPADLHASVEPAVVEPAVAPEPDKLPEPEIASGPLGDRGSEEAAGQLEDPGPVRSADDPEAKEDREPAETVNSPEPAEGPEPAAPTAAPAGTSLEKRFAGPSDIALNIDDQVPRTFTFWLRRVRQVTDKEPDNRLNISDALEKNYYQELIARNTEKEYLNQAGVEFDLEKKEDRIIARFIKEDPQVIKPALTIQAKEQPANAAAGSDQEDEVVSETLAQIYIDQNLTEKAVRMYRKLSLKFPEKSAYFAGLIEKLKK